MRIASILVSTHTVLWTLEAVTVGDLGGAYLRFYLSLRVVTAAGPIHHADHDPASRVTVSPLCPVMNCNNSTSSTSI